MNILKALFSSTSLPVEEAKERISQKSFFVLDVRQPDEFHGGHIEGAKLIPLNQLSKRLNEIPRDKEILCVCRSGSRSGMATSQLKSAGYNATNLRGGMMAWQGAGLPVKTGR